MSVDDKVVAISFESSKFEQGVNRTISSLDKLKSKLSFPAAGEGINKVSQALGHMQLGKVGQAVDSVSNKLKTFHLVAIGVLANLSASAVRAGARFAKALTLDPIIQGFQEYQTQINAVQTILANTAVAGTKLKDVNKALAELNKYADKTIYNFSEMTKNIGTFTAAGVDLKTSVASIKGIANIAAVSGSNAEQASMAMYQLSQAISSGTVKLQDWNSVVNAGMGGSLFQRALAQTAQHMGTLKQGAVTLKGAMKTVTIDGESFRQSLASAGPGKKSWLTSDVLTTTLKQLSGDMTDAQLKAMGYNDAQVKAIQTQAKMAVNAATQVKTLSQLLDTTKEAVGSGWARTWQIIFGDFGEAKTLFTNLSNAINGFVGASAAARNKVLADWKSLGGRTLLIDSLKNAFHDLTLVVKPIKDAFHDIFPPVTGKNLYDLTKRFSDLIKRLEPSQKTIENIRRTFRGLFAILDIGKQAVMGIFSGLSQLFSSVGAGRGGFLSITGAIGDFLVKVDQALKKSDGLRNFFVTLGSILAAPIKLITALGGALANMFSGFSPGGVSEKLSGVTKAMSPLERAINAITNAWANLLSGFAGSAQIFQPVIQALANLLQGLGPALSNAINNMNFEAILQVIRTGLLGGMYLLFRNFFGKGSLMDQVSKGFAGGIMANISGSFKALEGSMVALQQNIKAKTLKEIAIAIALLTASVVALSFVDEKKLSSSMAAMTIAFGQLLGMMVGLDKFMSSGAWAKMPLITASLVLLAGAIDLLTLAVVGLAQLSWGQLIKGLGGVTVLLVGLVAVAPALSLNSAGMIKAGAGITAIGIGLNVVALAVRSMGTIGLADLAKGLVGIAAALGIVVGAMMLMPADIGGKALALIAVAAAMRIMANAVGAMGALDLKTIGKGLLGVAGALVVIGTAMWLMPPTLVLTAAGLLLVSVALEHIAKAVATMGGMSIAAVGKGLLTMAGALVLLAAAMIAMEAGIGGAVALTVAAAGIALLAPALAILGKQSWGQIIKGLVALAGVFVVIGAAAILLTSAIPAMLGFGAALVLVGAGLALAGAGIALIGIGLSSIAVAAPTAVGIALQAFTDFQKGLIKNIKLLALGLVQIVKAIADVAPRIVDSLVKILSSVVDAIIQLSPKVKEALDALIKLILQVIHDNQDKIIQAGFDLLLALLAGINNNIGKVITMVANIVITILKALARNYVRIVNAGLNFVLNLIKGIAQSYVKVVKAATDLVANFLKGIAGGYTKILAAGLSLVTNIVKTIANNIGKLITAGASVIVNFVKGIGNSAGQVVTAGTNAITKFINAMVKGSLKLVDAGAKAVIKFLNGVADAINKYEPQIIQAGFRIGEALVTGMIKGMGGQAGNLLNKAKSLVGSVKDKLEFWHSPPDAYGEWLGQMIITGLAQGLSDTKDAEKSASEMSQNIIQTVKDAFQIASPSKVMYDLGQYVGQGFAQGLHGSADDINNAMADMNTNLKDAIQNARQTISDERAKIAEERKQTKPDLAAIKASQKVIKENQDILARSVAAHNALTGALQDEKKKLVGLANDYQKISDKLDAARQALDDAKATRADAIKGFRDQYSTLPDIVTTDAEGNAVDQLKTYETSLQMQAQAVANYQKTLDQLRKLGLDDKTYQKLLDEGTADQAFASQLLAGGKSAVNELNNLDARLDRVSQTLAAHAGSNLYDAGVKAAQGLVDGLEKKQGDLVRAMDKLADAMVAAIKTKLKIKSPSEVFADIGQYATAGMAKGLTDSTAVVTKAVESVADEATNAMKSSLAGMSDMISQEIDPNPTITPILDLSQLQNGSKQLASIIDKSPVMAATSFGQASVISAGEMVQTEQAVATTGAVVKFEQNNYSPTALTEIEIYRQTKNQLSQIKSALDAPT